jgi:hypothetical protein
MAQRKPFIPASARHDRVKNPPRVIVSKATRDIIAAGIAAEDAAKRDGKQGALDGIPNLVLDGVIASVFDDGDGGGPPKKDTTEKSTDKQEKEGKEGKESKDLGEKGKDVSEADKPGGENVEFGFVRYGLSTVIEAQRLSAAVAAHAARNLAKGPMV